MNSELRFRRITNVKCVIDPCSMANDPGIN